MSFFSNVWSWTKKCFGSSNTDSLNSAETAVITASATGVAWAIVQYANNDNKVGTAKIGAVCCDAVSTLCTGTSITEDQLISVLNSLKTDQNTQYIVALVNTFVKPFVTQVSTWVGSHSAVWVKQAQSVFLSTLKSYFVTYTAMHEKVSN